MGSFKLQGPQWYRIRIWGKLFGALLYRIIFIHHGLAPGISPSLRTQLDGTHRHILLVITKRTINYLSRVALSRGPAVVKAGQQSPKNK